MKDTSLRIPSDRPLFIINEDNDHYFKLSSDLMTEQALKDYIDDMAKGEHVTHVFFCPFGQRPSYASDVCEPIWAGMEEPDMNNKTHNIWCVNAKLLHDRGIDPYKVWLAHCRDKGISPWLSIRMNDVHFINTENYFRTCNFWREHPELRRNVDFDPNGGWESWAFDYSKEPVRHFHFSIFKELIDRYAPDGVELDWMRFVRHLTPGHEREQAHIITEFIRQCREYATEAAKRCGHAISLAVRMPTLPETAFCFGHSPVEWAAEGLVDLIVAANFIGTNDYAIPLDEWFRIIGRANPEVLVLPCATNCIYPYTGIATEEMCMDYYRSWGDLMYSMGAKGLYLFNAPYLPKEKLDELYGEGLTPQRLACATRRFPVSFHDCVAHPDMADIQLPRSTAQENSFALLLSNIHSDSSITVIMGFKENDVDTPPAVTLNAIPELDPPVHYKKTPQFVGYLFSNSAFAYKFPSYAARDGMNHIRTAKCDGAPATITWCEILVEH